MAKIQPFILNREIERAIEDAMMGYDYLWHHMVVVDKVGITDHGVDVWMTVHVDVQYDVQEKAGGDNHG